MHGNREASTRWFNPFEQIQYVRTAKSLIPRKGATVFIQLHREERIPSWVLAQVDLEQIEAAAQGES